MIQTERKRFRRGVGIWRQRDSNPAPLITNKIGPNKVAVHLETLAQNVYAVFA
jgi:hypothetical protein